MTKSIVSQFYNAFKNHDAEKMASFYHEDAVFEDPAFGKLNAKQASAMWGMLMKRSKGDLQVEFDVLHSDENNALCNWEAKYKFGPKKRPIHNRIQAKMKFQDGKIVYHKDEFSFWKWSGMALGPAGWLLGFTPIIHNKVQKTVAILLADYMRETKV
mgnify:CR=1 FL=1